MKSKEGSLVISRAECALLYVNGLRKELDTPDHEHFGYCVAFMGQNMSQFESMGSCQTQCFQCCPSTANQESHDLS